MSLDHPNQTRGWWLQLAHGWCTHGLGHGQHSCKWRGCAPVQHCHSKAQNGLVTRESQQGKERTCNFIFSWKRLLMHWFTLCWTLNDAHIHQFDTQLHGITSLRLATSHDCSWPRPNPESCFYHNRNLSLAIKYSHDRLFMIRPDKIVVIRQSRR